LNGTPDTGSFTASFTIYWGPASTVPEPRYTAITGIALALVALAFTLRGRSYNRAPNCQSK
jgi:hypothetical protein